MTLNLKDLGQRALTLQEAEEVTVCFYKQNGVLMRKWRPPDAPASDEWQVVHQIVVPKVYHREVISIAHGVIWLDIKELGRHMIGFLIIFDGLHLGRMFLSIADLATLVKWWASVIRRSLRLR